MEPMARNTIRVSHWGPSPAWSRSGKRRIRAGSAGGSGSSSPPATVTPIVRTSTEVTAADSKPSEAVHFPARSRVVLMCC